MHDSNRWGYKTDVLVVIQCDSPEPGKRPTVSMSIVCCDLQY